MNHQIGVKLSSLVPALDLATAERYKLKTLTLQAVMIAGVVSHTYIAARSRGDRGSTGLAHAAVYVNWLSDRALEADGLDTDEKRAFVYAEADRILADEMEKAIGAISPIVETTNGSKDIN